VWVGATIVGRNQELVGLSLPLSVLTVVWCARNKNSVIYLMGVIPIAGKWLAVLDVVMVVFGLGAGAPLMGLFAALPLGIGWLYADERIPFLRYGLAPTPTIQKKKEREEFHKYIDDVREKQKEREERDRLRKLLESSLHDDDK